MDIEIPAAHKRPKDMDTTTYLPPVGFPRRVTTVDSPADKDLVVDRDFVVDKDFEQGPVADKTAADRAVVADHQNC